MQLQKLSATIIGLIAGLLMIGVGWILFKNNIALSSPLQYTGYAIYGIAIVYVITRFAKTNREQLSFSNLFGQGFRCFVVVALLMSLYTYIFYKSQPGLINDMADRTRQELLKTDKDHNAQEINKMIDEGKPRIALFAVYSAVFQYLLIGSIVTLVASGTQLLNRKN